MLKILKAKARKNKKENNIVIGAKGTGMVRAYIKPIVTGEDWYEGDYSFDDNQSLILW